MRRHTIKPRRDWQTRVEGKGLTFHSLADRPYWDESAYWEFTSAEIDRLEAATAELHSMCLKAGQAILDGNRFADLHIPEPAIPFIRRTWDEEPPALYGRMDLAYSGRDIKLLEYNADTPTSLVEAAVIQWYWLQDVFPDADQFNSIHEKLVAKWKDLLPYVAQPVYFGHEGAEEDLITIAYLRDTAQQAGLRTVAIRMENLGWRERDQSFVDLGEQPIGTMFKLYPWETMLRDTFGENALRGMASGQHAEPGRTQWIEPVWKMLWSNKAVLAILWELFPGHELLLPAYLDGPRKMARYVSKPFFGREGCNITLMKDGTATVTDGSYGADPLVYQSLATLNSADGNTMMIGSWLIDGEPCGIGVREAEGPIVRNADRFVPHLFR